tara:strand:+ start:3245 stop:3658 length:414 start_codon:yes stop_codon:yes gene_type:complete
MVRVQNDPRVSEREDVSRIRLVLSGLATGLASQRSGAEFRLSNKYGWGDDPATYIQLFQIGPDKGILARKRRRLLAVRVSDYSNFKDRKFERGNNCPIQVRCFDSEIEYMAAESFDQLAQQLEVPGGVSIDRFGYST